MGKITVKNLGKAYKQYSSRWSRLAEWIVPFSKIRHTLKWVIQDVSFIVNAGEAVGIIGMNGAGKSTLLKMITGTTQPTIGSVGVTGRLAALLELGMGFHPDFTGRQNVYMSGQLLGYSIEEIDSFMLEIIAFSDIGDYIDQPVRIYSSGMQMRLAFSVATARRPDVLIIDEALSVGDAYFQHKSFDRIREFREQGMTLLIVSHDKSAILSICDRAILLNDGVLSMEGEPEAVMDYYNGMIAERENENVRQEFTDQGKIQTISGSGEASIEDVALLNDENESLQSLNVGQQVKLKITVKIHYDIPDFVVGYVIKDRLGQSVFGTNTHHLKRNLKTLRKGAEVEFIFQFSANLGVGTYSIAIGLHASESHLDKNYEWRDLALIFDVVNADKAPFIGVAWLPPVLEDTL
jgi:lipopolysaccharide transport system ATP-binding protein|tara:strand:- start:8 stop:1228 length:1221 start_codon:yes stop_codon:yes gene_type:complete